MTVQANPQMAMGLGMTPPSTESSTSTLAPAVDFDSITIEFLNEQKEIKELAAWVEEKYNKAKSARAQIERQWYLNMAFYQGRQWVAYLPNVTGVGITGKLVTPPAPPYRVRAVVNRVRSVIRTELSRLTTNKPNASVVPASSEDEDLFAAQAGEQVWESIYQTRQLPTVFRRTIFWTCICGTGFTKVWWDKAASYTDSDGNVIQGDIKYAPVTPFHIFVPDLTEEEIENQPYVINAYTKPVEWCNQVYGPDFKASTVATNEIVENGFLNLASAGQDVKPDSCLVLEVWFKSGAHKMFPRGGYVTIVDKRVVSIKNEGMLFAHGEYPFIKFDHMPTGAFYAASVLEDVIPVQRELNRTRSQIIEAKNRMAKPQLIAPKGSVDPAKITSEPGIVIQYRPGLAPPQPLPLTPLPNYVLQEIDRSLADIEDLTSQHQVSKGTAPPGVTAATAISYLQERDDSVLSTTYQSVEAGWEKMAKQTLSHVVQFWETERIVQVTGVDGSFDSIALKGADIAKGMDIRIEAGSALPVSKAARQALLMDLITQGIIPPDKGLKLMEIGGVNKLYEEMAVDERQAQRENLRMRSLDIDEIMQHLAYVNEENARREAEEQATMPVQMPGEQPPQPETDPSQIPPMSQQIPQQPNPTQTVASPTAGNPSPAPPIGGPPPPENSPTTPPGPIPPLAAQRGQPYAPVSSAGADISTGDPLQVPQNIIAVNTWDNHPVHIDVHNRFRKSQAFELLPDPIKQQFEYHVQMHAAALNQSAAVAGASPDNAMPPGSENTPPPPDQSSMPPGTNQFGPPDQGAPVSPEGAPTNG